MNALKMALALGASFLCLSCQSKIDRNDVVGTFIANDAASKDIIEVLDNGTYVHTYSLSPGGPEITSTNTWTYDTDEGEPRITFKAFVCGTPFVHATAGMGRGESGYWDVDVRKSFGRVRLCINEDLNRWYVKVNSTRQP